MKRIESMLISILVLFCLMTPLASAYILDSELMSQDPIPVNNGDVVELFFKADIKNKENPPENLLFKIFPEYPFSLTTNENDTREFGNVINVHYTESFTFKYRLLVDENANKGDNEIKLGYSVDGGKGFITHDYVVSVAETRTDFDVIVQDVSESSTTLAVVNIGANTGYSVIVRIPEQENFRVNGASANVMGNIDAGDYTLAIFQIISIGSIPEMPTGITNTTERAAWREMMASTRNTTNITTGIRSNLIVEISYTDALGIRRTIQKEVSLGSTGTTGTTGTGITGTRIRTTQGIGLSILSGSGLTYIVIGIVGIVVIVTFIKLRGRIRRKKK